jgi:glycosidase
LYEGGAPAALQLPTFLGNHDNGRFGMVLRKTLPNAGDQEILARDLLGHAMLLTLRGVPTIYSGDEQGFAGKGGDQDARQDMFASQTATYNEDSLIGSGSTTARANFNRDHPLYRQIAELARIRTTHKALTRGLQLVRYAQDKPGLFAVSRFEPGTGREMLLLFNTSNEPLRQHVRVETRSLKFDQLAGTCPASAVAPGSVEIALPALGYAVCHAR